MHLSPDEIVFWQQGFVKLNATIVYTWGLMLLLVLGARLATARLAAGQARSRWQNFLEMLVLGMTRQLEDLGLSPGARYLGFVGTLFLFIGVAALATVLPGYEPPTASLSTTAALALAVFVAVPCFGLGRQGWRGYLRSYLEPTPIMLPFHLISELSRTLALAVRLFGNMMSGSMLVAMLLALAPFIFPMVMTALGLLTGMVQAYIFSVLAAVYIAAASQSHGSLSPPPPQSANPSTGGSAHG